MASTLLPNYTVQRLIVLNVLIRAPVLLGGVIRNVELDLMFLKEILFA